MKKLVVIALLAMGLTSNAQKTIYAEANGNGVCKNMKTDEVINTNLSSKLKIDFEQAVVTITIDTGEAMYHIIDNKEYKNFYDGKIVTDNVLTCSNDVQKIQVCYSDDTSDELIGYCEIPAEEYIHFVYKTKPSKTKNYATVKKIKKN